MEFDFEGTRFKLLPMGMKDPTRPELRDNWEIRDDIVTQPRIQSLLAAPAKIRLVKIETIQGPDAVIKVLDDSLVIQEQKMKAFTASVDQQLREFNETLVVNNLTLINSTRLALTELNTQVNELKNTVLGIRDYLDSLEKKVKEVATDKKKISAKDIFNN